MASHVAAAAPPFTGPRIVGRPEPVCDPALDDDQTRSDLDQVSSDGDQTAADVDQGAADADQRASDENQATADRDEARADGDDRSDRAYAETRRQRAAASEQRSATSTLRDDNGRQRSQHATERDRTARLRDASADARDREVEGVEEEIERLWASVGPEGTTDRTAALLRLMEASRKRAAADRERAAADRLRAADDRARAAQDRKQGRLDLEQAHFDELTGVYTRRFGLFEMKHHIERAHRLGEPFTLAFVDVDGLKQINDRHGHAAGDEVLRAVGHRLRAALRSYDPVVRIGGDEFLCALSRTGLQAAERRLEQIRQALTPGVSISVGFAELRSGERLRDVTARGDRDLYDNKARTR